MESQYVLGQDSVLSPASRSPSSAQQPIQNDGTKLIVNYIPDTVNETVLYNLFVHYGEIESVRIMRDQQGNPKGYGFVKYTDSDPAIEAIQMLNGLEIGHKRIKVGYCRPGGSRSRSNLFVGSLPWTWTEEDLIAMFADFKPIIDVRILREQDGTSKRCGFVRLDSELKANLAIQKFHKVSIQGHPIQVSIANNKKKQGMGSGSCSPVNSMSPQNHSPVNMSPNTMSSNGPAVYQYQQPVMNGMSVRASSPTEQPVSFAPQPMGYIQIPSGMIQSNMTNMNMNQANMNMTQTTNLRPMNQLNLAQSPNMIAMPQPQTLPITNLSDSIPKLPNFFDNSNSASFQNSMTTGQFSYQAATPGQPAEPKEEK